MRYLSFTFLALAACRPEIESRAYGCGPEGLCPEGLACHYGELESFSFSCVLPREAGDFACPEERIDLEPDDSEAEANDLGELRCGDQLTSVEVGCISSEQDADVFRFDRTSACEGSGNDPRLSIRVVYALGAVPLKVQLLSGSGAIEAESEPCVGSDPSDGDDEVCVDLPEHPAGMYFVRVVADSETQEDCGGTCNFNRYRLTVASPLN